MARSVGVRRALLPLVTVTVLAVAGLVGGEVPSAHADDPPSHTLSPSGDDYREVAVGRTVSGRTLTAKNTSQVPIIIGVRQTGFSYTDVERTGSCGTWAPIAPGKTCSIRVALTPHRNGPDSGTISTFVRDQFGGEVPGTAQHSFLRIWGTAPSYSATNSVAFGTVPVGTTVLRGATIKNTSGAPIRVQLTESLSTSVTLGDGASRCDAAAPFELAPGAVCHLYLTYAPRSAGYPMTGVIDVDLLDITGAVFYHSRKSIKLSGKATAPRYGVTPTQVNFGEVLFGRSPVRTVTVKNTGSGPAWMRVVLGAGSGFTFPGGAQACPLGVTIPLAAQASCTLSVMFQPVTTVPQALNVRVESLNPDGGSIGGDYKTVKVTGRGVASSFRVTPLSVSNKMPFGGGQTTRITVRNTSTVLATFAADPSFGSTYALVDGPSRCDVSPTWTLLPGSDCSLWVEFRPDAAATTPGYLHVDVLNPNGNSVTSKRQTVRFKGVGTAPPFTVSPTGVRIGKQPVGTTTIRTVTVKNTSKVTEQLRILTPMLQAGVSLVGGTSRCDNPGEQIQGPGLTGDRFLAPGQTCFLYVAFAPTSPGRSATSKITVALVAPAGGVDVTSQKTITVGTEAVANNV